MEKIYMTEQEAAEYLQISQKHMIKLRVKYGFPYVRVSPRIIRYTRASLDQYLENLFSKANKK